MLIPNTNQLNYKSGFCSCHFETHTIQFQTISHPCSQNVKCTLHCKISPSGLKWEKGWSQHPSQHVQAIAAARLLGSSAPQFAGKEKILIRYAWNIWLLPHLTAASTGTRRKIITGDVCCRLICTSRQDDGGQDPAHNWGLWSNVWFDQADISGDKEVRIRWDHDCLVCKQHVMCYQFKVSKPDVNPRQMPLCMFRAPQCQ